MASIANQNWLFLVSTRFSYKCCLSLVFNSNSHLLNLTSSDECSRASKSYSANSFGNACTTARLPPFNVDFTVHTHIHTQLCLLGKWLCRFLEGTKEAARCWLHPPTVANTLYPLAYAWGRSLHGLTTCVHLDLSTAANQAHPQYMR